MVIEEEATHHCHCHDADQGSPETGIDGQQGEALDSRPCSVDNTSF
jgi:hypothetical protein